MIEIEDRKALTAIQIREMHREILKSVQQAAKKRGAHVHPASSSNWGSRSERLSIVEDLIWQIVDQIAVPIDEG